MNASMAQYVEDYLQTKMNTTYPLVPVQYDNTPSPDTNDTFVQIFFLSGDAFPASVGLNAVKRYPGVFQANVFTQRDIGAGEATDIAETIGTWFQREVFSVSGDTLRFRDYTIQSRGEINGRFKMEMRIGYQFDENC